MAFPCAWGAWAIECYGRNQEMKMHSIRVGIIAPTAEVHDALRPVIESTGKATVSLQEYQYCSKTTDVPVRKVIENRPDILMVDLQDPEDAIATLSVMHLAVPNVGLFATSDSSDSQLIVDTVRAGAREFLVRPISASLVSEAISRFAAEKHKHSPVDTAENEIYCVISAKGGSGATSIAINLAVAVAGLPETRVSLIDLNNPLGDMGAYLNLRSKFNTSDALDATDRLDPILLESFMTSAFGISVLPAVREFHPEEPGKAAQLIKLLEVLNETYTHSFIDLQSSTSEDQRSMIFDKCTGVIIVFTPDLPGISRADRLLQHIKARHGSEKLHLLLNRNSRQVDFTDRGIEETLQFPICWKLPNNYKASIRALNEGKPVVSMNHSSLSSNYKQLAQQLTGLTMPKKERWFSLRVLQRGGASLDG